MGANLDRIAECKAAYPQIVGSNVTTAVNYNVTELYGNATATVLGVDVPLQPMGLRGTNAFVSKKIPKALKKQGINRVLFSVDSDGMNSKIVVDTPAPTGYTRQYFCDFSSTLFGNV